MSRLKQHWTSFIHKYISKQRTLEMYKKRMRGRMLQINSEYNLRVFNFFQIIIADPHPIEYPVLGSSFSTFVFIFVNPRIKQSMAGATPFRLLISGGDGFQTVSLLIGAASDPLFLLDLKLSESHTGGLQPYFWRAQERNYFLMHWRPTTSNLQWCPLMAGAAVAAFTFPQKKFVPA